MRKAVVIGIDHYEQIPGLHGCVNDAYNVKSALERNMDGTVNFGVKLLTATGASDPVSRADIRNAAESLFKDDSDIALFYFAGHGHIEATGGYLCGSDCKNGHDGLALNEIVTLANKSKARNKIIILDSCHSGVAGNSTAAAQAELSDGLTILTASTEHQYASEVNGSGVFTTLLVDALNGAAGNLLGNVTPGSVYAHIDQSLGPWDQRPVFKTNVTSFVSLRQVVAPVSLGDLHRLTEFFPTPGHVFPLDPSFEPDPTRPAGAPTPDPANMAVFKILQQFNRVNLVIPVDAQHMYFAAMESKGCKLTVLGEHYRRLVERDLI
jgi:hypothetical protein